MSSLLSINLPLLLLVPSMLTLCVKRDTASGGQTVKTGKRKPRNKIVIGESKSSCTFQGVSKKSVICVNRLHPSTTAEMVSDFLQSKALMLSPVFCSTETNKSSVILQVLGCAFHSHTYPKYLTTTFGHLK